MILIGLGSFSFLFGGGRSTVDLLQEAAERRENRGANRSERAQEVLANKQATPLTEPTPVETEPSETPPSTPLPADPTDIAELAELYVRQYEEGSGVTLSDEAFEAKKAEVADFYSQIADGEERLDAVVFANDNPTDSVA